jgi:LAO/AO transport system kinase
VVNKSDRAGSSTFLKNLHQLVHSKPLSNWNVPVIAAVATKDEGTASIIKEIQNHQQVALNTKRAYLLSEKAFRLIQNHKMKGVSKKQLYEKIVLQAQSPDFNLYRFVETLLD